MIDFLIESTISLTVLLAFYHLVLEREKMHEFNRFYMLFSIAISIIIPFISIEIIQENETVSLPTNFPIFIGSENIIPAKETRNFTPVILWSLYIIVSLILLFRFFKNISYLKKTIQSNEKVSYKNATLVLLQEKIIPHTFLNYIFLNKESYNNRTIEKELYEHELTHVNQKHSYDILGIEILKIIFWFNPIFNFYKKAIQLNHEFIADEKVLKTHQNVSFYQSLLLNTNGNTTYYLASNLNYLITKKRLIMMTKTTSKKLSIVKKLTIIPMLIGLIYFFSIQVIAQVKKISVKSEINETDQVKTTVNQAKERSVEYLTYKVSDEEYYKDVICVYYENVDENEIKNLPVEKITFSKKYQNLTNDEIAKLEFLKFRQEPTVKKSPTQEEINGFQNSKKYAIWIDGVFVENSKLKNYKLSDIASFSGSVILKNARTKKHPQPFQYWFYTNKYYKDNNMDKWLSRYPGDSIVVTVSKEK